uniref:C2H2-type domain-containing protein n=1 Tax=Gopherus evgoodei TaxID=1825980 RepID=A0A8C4VJR7_9SAUR
SRTAQRLSGRAGKSWDPTKATGSSPVCLVPCRCPGLMVGITPSSHLTPGGSPHLPQHWGICFCPSAASLSLNKEENPQQEGSVGTELHRTSATQRGGGSETPGGAGPQQAEPLKENEARMGEKLYQCTQCHKRFSHSSNLLCHWRSHMGEKLFHCTVCGKVFTQHGNLHGHCHSHTGKRPYTCLECGKGFGVSFALMVHQCIHTGERPYWCGECGRGFCHSFNLVRHLHTHTGERPFSCAQCGKRFGESSTLIQHRCTHTGEHLYQCSDCEQGFKGVGSLGGNQLRETLPWTHLGGKGLSRDSAPGNPHPRKPLPLTHRLCGKEADMVTQPLPSSEIPVCCGGWPGSWEC